LLFSVDRPLVVQFAANDPVHFGLAAQKVAKCVNSFEFDPVFC
jgi:hypothetical protein